DLLLQTYPKEATAAWAYTRALLAFRRHGDSPKSRQLLKAAKKSNKHVITYLLQEKCAPEELPPYYRFGDENEAIIYVERCRSGWRNTDGALAWLQEAHKPASKRAGRLNTPRGPLPLSKERLRRLPHANVWQADFRQLPTLVKVGQQLRRPWS